MENALTWLRGKSDLLIATSVVVVILIMIIPLNPFFVDLFISIKHLYVAHDSCFSACTRTGRSISPYSLQSS